jgi:hypothetical protein
LPGQIIDITIEIKKLYHEKNNTYNGRAIDVEFAGGHTCAGFNVNSKKGREGS